MTVVFMIVSAMLVERSFLTGWVQMGEKSSRKRRRKKTTKGGKKSSLKRPVVALTVKEWNLVKRDLREWLSLMPIFFFRSEEHTSEVQSAGHLVCRVLLVRSHIQLVAI